MYKRQEMLRDAGYDAVGMSSAEEALALCARRPFALALIDLDMPTVNGLERSKSFTKFSEIAF